MPALYTSPRFVALSATNQLLPGAKLTFSVSGTSTLQNVYQDVALTVPHANPVVADGAGVFAKIYLDPALPSYRVLLTDSANVTQPGYPIDDYPSNQNIAQTLRLKSPAPELILEETDASAGNQKWRIRVSTERMIISLLNDAESVATDVAIFDRLGSVSNAIALAGTDISLDGNVDITGDISVASDISVAGDATVGGKTVVTNNPVLALPGAAGAPGFGFTTGPTNGMYLYGVNELGWVTNGVLRARLQSNYFSVIPSNIQTNNEDNFIRWGTGSPEGAATAKVGSMFLRTDGGANTTLYIKESGDNTVNGWVAK